MKSFKGKVAAITGAGSGMGRELAYELAQAGCSLSLSDVNEQGLAETAAKAREYGVKVTAEKVDVAKREQISPQSMGATTAALEARGLIERTADPDDGRRQILSPTKAGLATVPGRRNARPEAMAAGLEQMKFYEVGPHISLTQHAITVRPLAFSNKTFERLPPELQDCVISAGKEAGKYGREIESTEDAQKLQAMEEKGWITTHEFTEKDKMLELAQPVKQAYAEDLGAGDVLAAINQIQ